MTAKLALVPFIFTSFSKFKVHTVTHTHRLYLYTSTGIYRNGCTSWWRRGYSHDSQSISHLRTTLAFVLIHKIWHLFRRLCRRFRSYMQRILTIRKADLFHLQDIRGFAIGKGCVILADLDQYLRDMHYRTFLGL